MRRKSTRHTTKASPEKVKEEKAPKRGRRQTKRHKETSSSESDSDEEIKVQKPVTDIEDDTSTSAPSNPESTIKTSEDAVTIDSQKIKSLMGPTPNTPERTSRRLRNKTGIQEEQEPEEKISRSRTRRRAASPKKEDIKDDTADTKGKGKSKGKLKSKIDESSQITEVEMKGEISANVQVTAQSPQNDNTDVENIHHGLSKLEDNKSAADHGDTLIEADQNKEQECFLKNSTDKSSVECSIEPLTTETANLSEIKTTEVVNTESAIIDNSNEINTDSATAKSDETLSQGDESNIGLKDQVESENNGEATASDKPDSDDTKTSEVTSETKTETDVIETIKSTEEAKIVLSNDSKNTETVDCNIAVVDDKEIISDDTVKELINNPEVVKIAPLQCTNSDKPSDDEDSHQCIDNVEEESIIPHQINDRQVSPNESQEKIVEETVIQHEHSNIDEHIIQHESSNFGDNIIQHETSNIDNKIIQQKTSNIDGNVIQYESNNTNEIVNAKNIETSDKKSADDDITDTQNEKQCSANVVTGTSPFKKAEVADTKTTENTVEIENTSDKDPSEIKNCERKSIESRKLHKSLDETNKVSTAHGKHKTTKRIEIRKQSQNSELNGKTKEMEHIPRKWSTSVQLYDFTPLINVSLHNLKIIYPEVTFLDEEDVKLEVKLHRDRKASASERYELKRKQRRDTLEEKVKHKDEIEEKNEETVNNVDNIIAMNRKISIVSDDASKLRPPPSPAKNDKTEVLFLTNLVRPFTIKQLKELLERTGNIVEDGFWTDRIKSKCYVHYQTVDEAEATRNALHGVHWPIGNGKKLMIDYSTKECLENAKNPPPPPPVPVVVTVPKSTGKENEEPDVKRQRVENETNEVKVKPTHNDDIDSKKEDMPRGRSKSKGRSEKRRYSRHSRSPSAEIHRKQKKNEEVPQRAMDDLFKKTEATPCIYWQPLSPQEIALKQQQRLERMAEHKRRMETHTRVKRGSDHPRGASYRRRY